MTKTHVTVPGKMTTLVTLIGTLVEGGKTWTVDVVTTAGRTGRVGSVGILSGKIVYCYYGDSTGAEAFLSLTSDTYLDDSALSSVNNWSDKPSNIFQDSLGLLLDAAIRMDTLERA